MAGKSLEYPKNGTFAGLLDLSRDSPHPLAQAMETSLFVLALPPG